MAIGNKHPTLSLCRPRTDRNLQRMDYFNRCHNRSSRPDGSKTSYYPQILKKYTPSGDNLPQRHFTIEIKPQWEIDILLILCCRT